MKYKVGDKVKIKGRKWFKDKSYDNQIIIGLAIYRCDEYILEYCNKIMTIVDIEEPSKHLKSTGRYWMKEDYKTHVWANEMIECKVEE